MEQRLKKVREILKLNKVDALLISDVANIIYLTGYSGFSKEERDCFLLITKSKQYAITHALYIEETIEKIKNFDLIEIMGSRKQTLEDLTKKHKIKLLGVEANNLSFAEASALLKFVKIKNVDLDELRVIKDEKEISAIKKASKITDDTFRHVLKIIKIGITEKELAFEMDYYMRKNQADVAFRPIVAFGKNTSIPHHQKSNKKLAKNDVVLLDFGAKFDSYCCDESRTFVFGKANEEFKKMYQVTLDSQKKALELLNSNRKDILASEVDLVSRDYISKNGFPSIPHCLGHGVGLEVHESPTIYKKYLTKLKPGMILTLEPGIYVPGFGGIRIEDLVLIKNTGVELLTKSPRKLLEI